MGMGKEPPKTKKQLQSVLGSLNQLSTWMPQIKTQIPLMRKLSGGNNQFKESEQLKEEFELMKNQLKKTVTLSPLEVGRELHLHTDASNNGLGFTLSQPHRDVNNEDYNNYNIRRNLITLGSAGLSETQQRYSACEQECLAVLHAIQKVDHFVRGAPEIKVFTDNKNIRDYFNMGLADIRNQRILNFREKLLGYNLTFVHVKGTSHAMADRHSRFPEENNTCLDLEDRFVPSVCSKSLRTLQVNENPKDHHLKTIGKSDDDYSYMVSAIKEKINPREIKEESELKKIEGSFQSLSLYDTNEGEIIVRDGQEILIPKPYRGEMLKELHSSHLSDTSMLNLAKSKLYWPGLKEDLKRVYKTCDQCLTNSISKPKASHEVIPTSMQVLQPNELVHLDYCEVEGKDILIIKCKSTGHMS